jgi:hypothetical protein
MAEAQYRPTQDEMPVGESCKQPGLVSRIEHRFSPTGFTLKIDIGLAIT